jgi:hypothetical protein
MWELAFDYAGFGECKREAEAVTHVGEAVDTTEHRRYRAQACAPRNQEHDEDLVFDRFCRGYPAEDLPGHHAGQRDHAGWSS